MGHSEKASRSKQLYDFPLYLTHQSFHFFFSYRPITLVRTLHYQYLNLLATRTQRHGSQANLILHDGDFSKQYSEQSEASKSSQSKQAEQSRASGAGGRAQASRKQSKAERRPTAHSGEQGKGRRTGRRSARASQSPHAQQQPTEPRKSLRQQPQAFTRTPTKPNPSKQTGRRGQPRPGEQHNHGAATHRRAPRASSTAPRKPPKTTDLHLKVPNGEQGREGAPAGAPHARARAHTRNSARRSHAKLQLSLIHI